MCSSGSSPNTRLLPAGGDPRALKASKSRSRTAPEMMQDEIAHRVNPHNMLGVGIVYGQKPGIVLPQELPVIHIGPQVIGPVRMVPQPGIPPGLHVYGQIRAFPGLVNDPGYGGRLSMGAFCIWGGLGIHIRSADDRLMGSGGQRRCETPVYSGVCALRSDAFQKALYQWRRRFPALILFLRAPRR